MFVKSVFLTQTDNLAFQAPDEFARQAPARGCHSGFDESVGYLVKMHVEYLIIVALAFEAVDETSGIPDVLLDCYCRLEDLVRVGV